MDLQARTPLTLPHPSPCAHCVHVHVHKCKHTHTPRERTAMDPQAWTPLTLHHPSPLTLHHPSMYTHAHMKTHTHRSCPGAVPPQTLPSHLRSGKEFTPCSHLPCRLLLHSPNPSQARGKAGCRRGERPRVLTRLLCGSMPWELICVFPRVCVCLFDPRGLPSTRSALVVGGTQLTPGHWDSPKGAYA